MKTLRFFFVFVVLCGSAAAVGCQPETVSPTAGTVEGPTSTAAPQPAPTTALPPTTAPPTPTAGQEIVVSSVEDSGPDTLRQALLDAQPGDTITFEPAVFPPDSPQTISVTSALPQISQGYVTLDASSAGVILDGSQLPRDSWIPGLEMVSDGNTIRGMQVINFTGVGIVVAGQGRNNTIGGDRNTGLGPIGQGNLSSSNNAGIGLWDYAANNTVTGNLIGTDASGAGELGNSGSGVWITEAGMDNTVGPDNIIAFNRGNGIDVERSESLRNVLTQNSIHDNAGVGIHLWRGGNTDLAAPFVSSFDLAGGTVTGTACAACMVEVFSDGGGQGAVFEGQVTADLRGLFAYNNGTAFTNPNITLTTTDPQGNTSGFSRPVGASSTILTLQDGNSLPVFGLVDRPSAELADSRVGMDSPAWFNVSNKSWNGSLDDVTDLGVKRVEVSLYEVEPPIVWSGSEYDIPEVFEDYIDDLNANGVAVNYLLHFWDKEGHANGVVLSTPRFRDEQQIQDFAEYVRFIVNHFKGRIQYYTIWSEPDYCGQDGIKCIRPESYYIDLAKAIAPVIREMDPEAKVVLAPVSNLFFTQDYLFALLDYDAISLFDVITWHGIYDAVPDSAFYGNYYYDYSSLVEQIEQTASAHGFEGEYWATELTWCSEQFPTCHPADQPWPQQPTDFLAAKYYSRAIVMHRGMGLGVSVGGTSPSAPWSYPTMRNLDTVMDGASPAGLEVEMETQATNIVSYGFALPDGDRLFALWTDGAAVEDDPSEKANLTFPGLSATQVAGIDPLYGFEQQLDFSIENGNLVIIGLRVRDYPILLRFSGVTFSP